MPNNPHSPSVSHYTKVFYYKYVFFPFLHMSEQTDRVLALIEGLPATALATQVICV